MSGGSRRSDAAARRREQLLGVALELFEQRGVQNVSVAELAARAGVAHGLIYHYFASKDELLAAVLERADPLSAFLALTERMHGRPVADGLCAFAEGLVEVIGQRRAAIRLLLREGLSPDSAMPSRLALLQEAVLDGLAGEFEARIRAGELRAHDPRVPLRMLISTVLVLGLVGQPVQPWLAGSIETILHGILPPGPGAVGRVSEPEEGCGGR